ncbi:MAG: hypothetical protein LBM87_01450 [Ruminococcus sp.]|jgi:hypothetical protein|nr:hypothetical protein [Ruminococcus sp.]
MSTREMLNLYINILPDEAIDKMEKIAIEYGVKPELPVKSLEERAEGIRILKSLSKKVDHEVDGREEWYKHLDEKYGSSD